MARAKGIPTLVLFAQYDVRASYYDDWLDAFKQSGIFDCSDLNICRSDAAVRLREAMQRAELIVLLHSCNADHLFYLDPLAPILADRRQILLSFVGNEVGLPGALISDKRQMFARFRPDYIATQLLLEAGEYLWGDLVRNKVLAVPHALNPEAFRTELEGHQRAIDLGVRSFRYPPHLGDDDRNRMMDFMAEIGPSYGLIVDIGEVRLGRKDWAGFLNSCKGTLATEAGSWFLSRDDAALREITEEMKGAGRQKWVISSENITLRRLSHRLPWRLRQLLISVLRKGPIGYEAFLSQAGDSKYIIERFFSNRARAPVYGKCISSRHFDAIGTGTAQILMEGRYNDILQPDEHYFSLKPDFSNAPEVLERFKDEGARAKIANAARSYVLERHTYKQRVNDLRNCLSI